MSYLFDLSLEFLLSTYCITTCYEDLSIVLTPSFYFTSKYLVLSGSTFINSGLNETIINCDLADNLLMHYAQFSL